MADSLLKERLPVLRINPKILIIYSKPKMGKTKIISELEDCLTLATEDGIEMYPARYYRITSISGGTTYHTEGPAKGQIKTTSLDYVYNMFIEEANRQIAAGEKLTPPYKFIALDTLDELQTLCEVSATAKYKNTTIGKNFKEESVLELPNGAGYYHLRNEVKEKIDLIAGICKHLILISHMKEKVQNKGGIDVVSTDISLVGILGAIVAAKADAIGYLYRSSEKDPKLMVSFETYDANSVMGARFERLAGKKMPFSWDTIFIPE